MIINANRQDDTLTVIPEGRLDTLSAPELEEFLEKYYASVSEIMFLPRVSVFCSEPIKPWTARAGS